jgi:hypothetical protein
MWLKMKNGGKPRRHNHDASSFRRFLKKILPQPNCFWTKKPGN